MLRQGPLNNLLTDIPGIRVGNARDVSIASGVTAVIFAEPATVSVAIVGGAPGTRETDILAPDALETGVDALVLSGGSAFGLDAASGVQAWLRAKGRGFPVGTFRVPIVPQAICNDLLNGGNKEWGRYPPYRELGHEAAHGATAGAFALGTAGGGFGATTLDLKGGLGSASVKTPSGFTVAAIVVVNAIGSALMGDGPHFFAAPYEIGREFGGLGWPALADFRNKLAWKRGLQTATTIALVATDAALTKAECQRLAMAAQGGLAKGLRLSHALTDGDVVFAASTGARPLENAIRDQIEIGACAADTLARAIARGVYEATALPFPGALPAWRDRFG
jgi:L-aminopeptidase/D-esterase-like protein